MIDTPQLTEIFGPIQHIGYIVPDLDAAIAGWRESVGIGPFVAFRQMNPFISLMYRGKPSEDVVISVAFGRSGPLLIELIQQHNDTPSIYTEALESGWHGPHHYAFSTTQYDRATKHALNIGMEAIVETGKRGTQRMTYFSYDNIGGFIAEVIEESPATRQHKANIAAQIDSARPNVMVIEAGGQ